MTQPAAVPFDGHDLVKWVPAIADISYPALSEINAGGAFDATCYLTGDGWNPVLTQDRVDDARLCSRLNFQLGGRKTWEMPMLYTINPESPDDDDARLTFVEDAEGYFVERPAAPYATALAAWDYVWVWSVKLSAPQLAGRTANGRWLQSQTAYLRPPGESGELVAVIAS